MHAPTRSMKLHSPLASRRLARRQPREVLLRAEQQPYDASASKASVELLRLVPLVAGAAGITGVVLNRALSGVAPVVTATSSQSRADVLAIVLSAVLLLSGLQWLSIQPRVYDPVAPEGEEIKYFAKDLPAAARREVQWIWAALRLATSASSLVLFARGRCVAYLGWAAHDAQPEAATPGPLCTQALKSGSGNYLANLQLFPGRLELMAYMPPNTQAALVQPVGGSAVAVVGGTRQRGFTRLEQAWLASLADKLERVLEREGAVGGAGFGSSCGKKK